METENKFGERLLALRVQRNETQEQLAKAISITRQSLSRYETNERTPSIDLIYRIAKHYNVSSDYLLGLSDVQTLDIDIQTACNLTGLSEGAIFACGILTNDEKKVIELLLSETLKCTDEEHEGNPLLFDLTEYIFNANSEIADDAFENMSKFSKIFTSKSMAQKLCDAIIFDNIKKGLIFLRNEASEHGEHNTPKE